MYAFVPLNSTTQTQHYVTIVKPVLVNQLISPEHQLTQETGLEPFNSLTNDKIVEDGVILPNHITTKQNGGISPTKNGAKTETERVTLTITPSGDKKYSNTIGDSDESEEDDVHICGKCRLEFVKYELFIQHKRACSLRKTPKLLPKQLVPEHQDPPTNSSPSLNTVSLPCSTVQEGQYFSDSFSPDKTPCLEHETSISDILHRNDYPEKKNISLNDESDDYNNESNIDDDNASDMDTDSRNIYKEKDQALPIITTTLDGDYEHSVDNISQKQTNATQQKNNNFTIVKENPKVYDKTKACNFKGCSYRARFNKDIARHYRTHSGAKPWSCNNCDKSFARKDKLTRHMSIHSGEKKYGCMYCPYKTYEKSHLIKHMRVHTDERPYLCQVCNYRAKSSSQISVHLRTHTGESPFKCETNGCESAFKTRSDLTRHQKIHAAEKPFKCDICGHQVSFKGNLKKHMVKVHNIV